MKLNNDLELLRKTDKVSYSDELFGIKKITLRFLRLLKYFL